MIDLKKVFGNKEEIYNRLYHLEGIVENIVESYPNGIPHGLQKDAIQNGWDAIDTRITKLSTSK